MKKLTILFTSLITVLTLILPAVQAQAATGTSFGITSLIPDTQEPQNLATNITITTSEPISAVVIKLDFTNLAYDDVRYNNAAFDTELAPVRSENGTVTFSRLRTDNGYSATNGVVLTVLWQPVAKGAASVQLDKAGSSAASFATGANVLANVNSTSENITTLPSQVPAGPQASIGKKVATMTEAQLHAAEQTAISSVEKVTGPLMDIRYIILIIGLVFLIFGLICVLLMRKWETSPAASRKPRAG